MNLAELKAQNAEAETVAEQPTQVVEVETEAAAEGEAQEIEQSGAIEQEGEAKAESVEGEEPEQEAWMQGDDHSSSADKKYTGSDIGAAKAKLKAKLERKHDTEVETLRAEIKALQQGKPVEVGAKPKRDQFFESDDPDEAYTDALLDWKLENKGAKQQAQTAQAQVEQRQKEQQLNNSVAVDQHYERAIKLAEKSQISAENYQQSDYRVRQMMDSVFPNSGDAITDALIANVGDGSEKVFYNLGVSPARLQELETRLKADPSGVKAAIYLGELKATLVAPQKRNTSAPKPAAQIQGDQTSTSAGALERKYLDAHKRKDIGAAFKLKREAKAAGVNTQNW